jgi:hypothetical protein
MAHHVAHWRAVLMAALLIGGATALFSGACANEAAVIPAKLGMSYLSPDQEKFLNQKIDQFAQSEAIMNLCGKSNHVESRLRKAVESCVEEAAMRIATVRFHSRLSAHRAKYREQFKAIACDSPAVARVLHNISSAITHDIEEAERMCQLCMFC